MGRENDTDLPLAVKTKQKNITTIGPAVRVHQTSLNERSKSINGSSVIGERDSRCARSTTVHNPNAIETTLKRRCKRIDGHNTRWVPMTSYFV